MKLYVLISNVDTNHGGHLTMVTLSYCSFAHAMIMSLGCLTIRGDYKSSVIGSILTGGRGLFMG